MHSDLCATSDQRYPLLHLLHHFVPVARQPQGRAASLYVCICKCVTTRMHVGGGQEYIKGGKGQGQRVNGRVKGGKILQCTSFSSVYWDLYLFPFRYVFLYVYLYLIHLVYMYVTYDTNIQIHVYEYARQ